MTAVILCEQCIKLAYYILFTEVWKLLGQPNITSFMKSGINNKNVFKVSLLMKAYEKNLACRYHPCITASAQKDWFV